MSDLRLVNSQTAQVEDWTTRNWAICKLLIYLNHIKTEELHLSNFHMGGSEFWILTSAPRQNELHR